MKNKKMLENEENRRKMHLGFRFKVVKLQNDDISRNPKFSGLI